MLLFLKHCYEINAQLHFSNTLTTNILICYNNIVLVAQEKMVVFET